MKKIYRLALYLIVGLVGISGVRAETGRVLLKENFKEGQSYNLLERINFRIAFGEGEEVIGVNMSLGLGYRFSILRCTPNGELTSKMWFHSIYFENPGVFGQIDTYDSTDPFAVPTQNSLIYAYLVGNEIETRVDRDGKLLDIRISEVYLDNIVKFLKNHGITVNKQELKDGVTANLGQYLSSESNGVEQGVYVKEPVGAGDSWNKLTRSDNNGLKLTFQTTYTLKERRNGVALIHCRSVIVAMENQSASNSTEFSDAAGGMEGDIEVDEASGWIRRIHLQTAITGTVRDKKKPKAEPDPKQSQEKGVSSAFTIIGDYSRETL
jgi:hypothetical protein